MSKANELIFKLEGGVDALIKKSSNLSVQVEELNSRIVGLNKQVEELEQQVVIQNNQNDVLKRRLESSNDDSADLDKYKLKINELVNEIDSCISLLNG